VQLNIHLLQATENISLSLELGWELLWPDCLGGAMYKSMEWMNGWMNVYVQPAARSSEAWLVLLH